MILSNLGKVALPLGRGLVGSCFGVQVKKNGFSTLGLSLIRCLNTQVFFSGFVFKDCGVVWAGSLHDWKD